MSHETSSAVERFIIPSDRGVQSKNWCGGLAMSYFDTYEPGQLSISPGARRPDSNAAVAVIGLNVEPAGYVPWNA